MATTSTRQRKAERERQRRRQQQIILLIGVIIVAVVAVVLVVLSSTPVPAPVEAAVSQAYAGVERGISEEGWPQLGSPDAPVTIHDYSAFSCPHCANFHDNQFMELLSEIRAGQVRFVYVPVNLNSSTFLATQAAFCAADQGKFWEMHDVLFSWLRQFGANAFVRQRVVQGAEDLGLDMTAFNACLESPEAQQRREAADNAFLSLIQRTQGQPNEVTGTPTLTFNGQPIAWGAGGASGAPTIEAIRQTIAELSGG